MPFVWMAIVRGVERRRIALVLVMLAMPIVTSHLALPLRTPEDREVYGQALANGVLVGLVLPVACLGGFLADRGCWLQPGSVRQLPLLRAGWFATLTATTLLMGIGLSAALVGRAPAQLVLADTLLLWGLCALSAVFVGGRNSWILPAGTALVFSVPGLIPLSANLLSLAAKSGQVRALSLVLIAIAGVLFCVFDEWRLTQGLQRSLTMGDEVE